MNAAQAPAGYSAMSQLGNAMAPPAPKEPIATILSQVDDGLHQLAGRLASLIQRVEPRPEKDCGPAALKEMRGVLGTALDIRNTVATLHAQCEMLEALL